MCVCVCVAVFQYTYTNIAIFIGRCLPLFTIPELVAVQFSVVVLDPEMTRYRSVTISNSPWSVSSGVSWSRFLLVSDHFSVDNVEGSCRLLSEAVPPFL